MNGDSRPPLLPRRAFLLGAAALAACRRVGATPETLPPPPDFADLAGSLGPGGRFGLAAIDTESGWAAAHQRDERFAMCSTFKVPLAAAILAEVDAGRMALDDPVPFGREDLTSYAPVIARNFERGRLPLGQLCAAILEVSDNSAANLLLRRIGGPEGLTGFIRRCGDEVTRLDRYEEALNTNLPGDPRDTTTPAAMLGLMRTLLLGDVLAPASRTRLTGWMEGSITGRERLRAGLPPAWRVGDKTGTGANGAHNDVAIAFPPGRAPILIASFVSGGDAPAATRNRVHAEAARRLATFFAAAHPPSGGPT